MEAGSPKHFCAVEKLHADWVFVELHGFRDACPVSPVMTETFGVAAKRLPTFVSSVVLLGFFWLLRQVGKSRTGRGLRWIKAEVPSAMAEAKDMEQASFPVQSAHGVVASRPNRTDARKITSKWAKTSDPW